MTRQPDLATLTDHIAGIKPRGRRRLIALAGPPASGKSTLAAHLADLLPRARVVPMDGFHLDNRLLEARGLLDRKGAPPTFDLAGLAHLMTRLATEDEVVFPLFDRALDCAIAGAGVVDAGTDTLVVEGNYLLLDQPGWRDLAALWDVSVYLDVPLDVLQARLIQRWRDHGLSPIAASARAEHNDLPNARLMAAHALPADFTLGPDGTLRRR